MSKFASTPYPAITACIYEDRRPSLVEMKRVIRRFRREIGASPDRLRDRHVTLMARAALEGLPAA